MSSPPSRLKSILGHLVPGSGSGPDPESESGSDPPDTYHHTHHLHTLSPTFFLERAAAIEPNAEAIVHTAATGGPVRRSYAAFARRAAGLAYWLRKHALRRVGVLAPNTPAFLELIFGVGAARAVLVPVNYRLHADDVRYILEFAEADVVFVDREFEGLLEGFARANPAVRVVVDWDSHRENEGPYAAAVAEGLRFDAESGARGWAGLHAQAEDEDDTLAIPFTSGTTARPKGVVYTHRGAYLAALANVIEAGLNLPHPGGGERATYLWTLPLFHAVGWTFPWAVAAVRGTSVCLRRLDYARVWRLLREEGVTHFSAAPTVNTLLCAAREAGRLPRPVGVTVAASPPTGTLFARMAELNLHPVHVYGLTETYGPITRGYVLPEWEGLAAGERFGNMARQGHGFVTSLPIRVVRRREGGEGEGEGDGEGVFEDVARDGKEIGEIVFVGNICAKGYYKDAEATRKLFAGGVLHSGDLAVWHPDGSAQILDRAKDIIISGGENISSVALESLLVQHPDVLEAGVVAVSDDKWGERPKAYLTVREGKEINQDAFIDWARKQSGVSRFMVPREVEVVDELPKTSTGKIKKNVLREWAKGGGREQ